MSLLYIYINCDNFQYMLVYGQKLMNYSSTCQISTPLFSDDLSDFAVAMDCDYDPYLGAVCTLSKSVRNISISF